MSPKTAEPMECLEALEALRFTFGRDSGRRKRALLEPLADAELPDADAVRRLLEISGVDEYLNVV